jgi:uncharacterized protein involved in propanediol utilization
MSAVGTLRSGLPVPTMTGVGTAFGTFGELLQGRLAEPDGDFLVTLPVARWSAATFWARPGTSDLRVVQRHKTKALALTRMIIAESGERVGGLLSVESSLPEGKGMASSSADLVATARAVSNALGIALPARRLEPMLARIEPTDGVLYPGVVAYHHRGVRLRAFLGSLPPLTIVAIDEGGQVDTLAYNRLPKRFTAAHCAEYAVLLDKICAAFGRGDLTAIGAVATRSAIMNQRFNPKRHLESVIGICARHGGLGVVNTHSGTILGILIDATDPRGPDRAAAVASECCALTGTVRVYRALSFERSAPHGHALAPLVLGASRVPGAQLARTAAFPAADRNAARCGSATRPAGGKDGTADGRRRTVRRGRPRPFAARPC